MSSLETGAGAPPMPPPPSESGASGPLPAASMPSVWERSVRVFVQPQKAWEGLETHARWWFPMLVIVAIQVILLASTFHHVLLPTMIEQWTQAVENGQMPPAQFDKIQDFFSNNPMALVLIVGQQALLLPVFTLLIALVAWFGVGFVLGTRFPYRHALEVVTWSGLVQIPQTILTFVIGWFNETLKGIHFGLGALLPAEETPTKLHQGLSVLLDAVGPFSIWYLVVAILGASALSGAPRKNVTWVLSALYVALTIVFAVVAALFTPGA